MMVFIALYLAREPAQHTHTQRLPGIDVSIDGGGGLFLIREDCESQSFSTVKILELMRTLDHEVDPYFRSTVRDP